MMIHSPRKENVTDGLFVRDVPDNIDVHVFVGSVGSSLRLIYNSISSSKCQRLGAGVCR